MSNTPNPVYEKLMKCYESFRSQIDFQPEVAMILGSGLGDFANDIRVTATLDYHDIEGFPVSTVPGHAGRFIFGYVGDVPVVCMQGRVHYYEGYPMTDVVLPTRLMKLLGAKTLFATHYHELTELEGKLPGVHNYCIAVKEKGDDIVFLRKIIKGGADKSYGIQVARLAGVPDMVIDRAKEIVKQLSDNDITEKVQSISVDTDTTAKKQKHYDEVDLEQFSLFDTVKDEDVLEELKNVDIQTLTPLDALNTLYRLQNKLKNRWGKG